MALYKMYPLPCKPGNCPTNSRELNAHKGDTLIMAYVSSKMGYLRRIDTELTSKVKYFTAFRQRPSLFAEFEDFGDGIFFAT